MALSFPLCLGGDRWRCFLGLLCGDRDLSFCLRLRSSFARIASSSDDEFRRYLVSPSSSCLRSLPLRTLYLSRDRFLFPLFSRCRFRTASMSSIRLASSSARAFCISDGWRSPSSSNELVGRFRFCAPDWPPSKAAMFPSWRPRISPAVGRYFLRFSSSASARSRRRACDSDCSLARRALLCRSVLLIIVCRNRVLGFSLFVGLLQQRVSSEVGGSGSYKVMRTWMTTMMRCRPPFPSWSILGNSLSLLSRGRRRHSRR